MDKFKVMNVDVCVEMEMGRRGGSKMAINDGRWVDFLYQQHNNLG